jgi:hypothetical protein
MLVVMRRCCRKARAWRTCLAEIAMSDPEQCEKGGDGAADQQQDAEQGE